MRSRRLNSPTLAGGFASQASQAMEVITRSLQARFICLLLQNARRWTLKCCWGARGPFPKQRMATLRVGHALFVMGGQIDPIDPDPSYAGEKSRHTREDTKRQPYYACVFQTTMRPRNMRNGTHVFKAPEREVCRPQKKTTAASSILLCTAHPPYLSKLSTRAT